MSILITTYEGNHNHPLPLRATAMASTTSAAASMLQSQSSSSQPGFAASSVSAPSSSTSFAANNYLALNFNLAQNSRPYQYHFPNSSISTNNSHPTITLDLTATATNNSSYFSRLSEYAPRYSSSTYLNFSSSPSSLLEGSLNPQITSWKTSQLSWAFDNHKSSFVGPILNTLGRQPPQRQENLYQSYNMQMTNHGSTSTPHDDRQQSFSETITAATKAITSNPNFHSALAAALTSYVGNYGGGTSGVPRDNHSGSEEKTSAQPSGVENELGCASGYLGKSSSFVNNIIPHQQQQKQGSLLLFPTLLTLPTSKTSTASDSPVSDNSNHIK